MKVTVGKKERPVIFVTIGTNRMLPMSEVKRIIAEMNKEYGESHTLYFTVKF